MKTQTVDFIFLFIVTKLNPPYVTALSQQACDPVYKQLVTDFCAKPLILLINQSLTHRHISLITVLTLNDPFALPMYRKLLVWSWSLNTSAARLSTLT